MSIKSYIKNTELGAAGADLPVCLPASIEKLATGYGFPPHLYDEYIAFMEYYDTLTNEERKKRCEEYEHMIEALVEPLGGLTLEDIIFKRIRSAQGLFKAVNSLHAKGFSVVVDVRYGNWNPDRAAHSVGLAQVEPGYVTLLSNHVPPKLRGVVSLAQVAEQLTVCNDAPLAGHPLHTANLVAFPNA